ncbi:MAG TPA: AAA family ATPase [Sideroxyarcus sp.]|nr:AAA family ATPase [Sideroxyarcus sp.]
MKLSRINRIRNHRIFRDFSWPNDLPDFTRFNVLYGWNGAGKTTLSNLLVHIQKKQPIIEGEVEFRFDQNNVAGRELATSPLPVLKVFNRDFVGAALFESSGQQFSPIYYLGEESVESQKKIEELKSLRGEAQKQLASAVSKKRAADNALDTFCIAQAKNIKEALNSTGQNFYNNYNKSNFTSKAQKLSPATYQSHILDTPAKIKLREKLTGKPKNRIEPLEADFPDLISLTDTIRDVLARSIVSNAIDKLTSNPSLAAWVQEGLALHQTDEGNLENCEFCGQQLPDSRIRHLESHFNDEFRKFQTELADIIAKVDTAKQELELVRPPETALFYEHLVDDLKQAISAINQHRWYVSSYLDALKKALLAKRENPFQKVDLLQYVGYEADPAEPKGFWGATFSILVDGVSNFAALKGQQAAKQINETIDEHNSLTDNFQSEIEKARAALELSAVAEAFPEFQSKNSQISSAEKEHQQADASAKNYQSQIEQFEQMVVQHRRPAEELNSEIRSYLGRDELTFDVRDSGYTITRHGKPAGNLSEGEKTAIAFLYFLKSLQDKSFDIHNGVVVIDDPVSSLDANSLYSAFGYMKERTKDAGQLFVLTHNFAFFRQVKNWFNHLPGQRRSRDIAGRPARFYMLQSAIHEGYRTAVLAKLDPMLHEHESEYHYLFKKVYDEAQRSMQNPALEDCYEMPNVARRLLEGFLAFRHPQKPTELQHQLDQVQFDPAKKSRIVRFLHTYSHHGYVAGPEHDLSILSETPKVLSNVLELIETVDKGHYDGMLAAITPHREGTT